LQLWPLEFTREFGGEFPQVSQGTPKDRVLINPTALGSGREAAVKKIAGVLSAYLKNYQAADALYLELPASDTKAKLEGVGLLADVVKLTAGLKRADGSAVEVVIGNPQSDALANLSKSLPAKAGMLVGTEATLFDLAGRTGDLDQAPVAKVPCQLALNIATGRLGVLSQNSPETLAELVGLARQAKWDGFVVRASILGEIDPVVYYLSRAAYDGKITARKAHDDLFVPTGGELGAERLWKAWNGQQGAGGRGPRRLCANRRDVAGVRQARAGPGVVQAGQRPAQRGDRRAVPRLPGNSRTREAVQFLRRQKV
jgi:hypothetical protein